MRSNAKPGWFFRCMLLEKSVVAGFEAQDGCLGTGFAGSIEIQQIVKPLHHDSGWEVSQRHKFVGNNVAVGIQQGRKRFVIQAGGIRRG